MFVFFSFFTMKPENTSLLLNFLQVKCINYVILGILPGIGWVKY